MARRMHPSGELKSSGMKSRDWAEEGGSDAKRVTFKINQATIF